MEHVSILGFDYGLRRIGVAIAYTETGTTHPLRTIQLPSPARNALAAKTLVDGWRPDMLVVGLPRYEQDPEHPHPLWKHILKFAGQLSIDGKPPLYLVDESYSSVDAELKLKDAEVSGRRAKPYLDQVAAQSILEGFLGDGIAIPYRPGMKERDIPAGGERLTELTVVGPGRATEPPLDGEDHLP